MLFEQTNPIQMFIKSKCPWGKIWTEQGNHTNVTGCLNNELNFEEMLLINHWANQRRLENQWGQYLMNEVANEYVTELEEVKHGKTLLSFVVQ